MKKAATKSKKAAPKPRKEKVFFSAIISYWRTYQQQIVRIPLTAGNAENDAVLLASVLHGMSPARLRALATISIAQYGGDPVPWLAQFLRENPGHRGGYKWHFGGEYLTKKR